MEIFLGIVLKIVFICGALLAAVLAICAVIFAVYTVWAVYRMRRVACAGDFDLDKWCTKVFAYVVQVILLSFLSGVISIVLYLAYHKL